MNGTTLLSLARFGYSFTFRWHWFLITLLFSGILSSLGVWQLHRAEQKKVILSDYNQRMQQQPLDFKSAETVKPYQMLRVHGTILQNKNLLLDNQHLNHQFGYQVLMPLLLETGEVILIDRGFIAGSNNRKTLPTIPTPAVKQSFSGYAYFPSGKGVLLGPVENNPGIWPRVIERIDTTHIAEILHRPVLRFIIRQQTEQNDGLTRQWSLVSMPPERHKAYALQWFSMALVVLILFIALNSERK